MPQVEKVLPLPHLLNEASFLRFDSRMEFVHALQAMVGVARKMCAYGYAAQLSCSRALLDRICYENVSLRDWLRESECVCEGEHEIRRYMRQSVTKVPFLEEAYPIFYEDSLFDVYREGVRIYMNTERSLPAFVVSVCFRLPTIALRTGGFASADSVELTVREVTEDGADCETRERSWVFSDGEQVDRHAEWLTKRIADEVGDSGDFNSIRGVMFPDLSFSKEVEEALSGHEIDFAHIPVLRALLKLQTAFRRMKGESIPFRDAYGRVKTLAMTESDTTRARRIGSRTFTWSDASRTCFPHVKIGSGFRIHFLPDSDADVLFVGYMGRHLPLG